MRATRRFLVGVLGVFAILCVASAANAADNPRVVEAVKGGRHEALRGLLKQPGMANAAEPDGSTPLLWAALGDDMESATLPL